MSGLLFG